MVEARTWVLGRAAFLAPASISEETKASRLKVLPASSFFGASLWTRQPRFLQEAISVTRQSQVCATIAVPGIRWWQKVGAPNMRDINSTHEFLDCLNSAGEKLVVVEFFSPWCGTCKSLYPKLCQIAGDNPDIEFLKVNIEENRTMCKSLKVHVLPLFHFYRGAEGRLTTFSCSLTKVQKLRDAIAKHNTDRCTIGPTLGLEGRIKLLGLPISMPTPAPAPAGYRIQ
eukprot:c21577_g1_i1 orf=342-1022(-)